jgi:type I restriction enzyme R subunit
VRIRKNRKGWSRKRLLSPSGGQKEAFSRVVIDAQFNDVGWNLTDGQSVRYEYQLPDGTFADRSPE